ncbi:E3 ubiquitin-protein ligase RMA1H1-like [Primulina tabacum]|uniref:E3 ubiquitin-protein ligase RMA1H1-like n=1 Tax=Primulina tabacum TaxID=48773 RepID=UPI003F5A83AD
MAFQEYFVQEWGPENISASFDCSICLDFARDPFPERIPRPKMSSPNGPVCKANISEKTMIPLYGRGLSFSKPEQETDTINPRPSASGIQHLPSHNLYVNEQNILDTG